MEQLSGCLCQCCVGSRGAFFKSTSLLASIDSILGVQPLKSSPLQNRWFDLGTDRQDEPAQSPSSAGIKRGSGLERLFPKSCDLGTDRLDKPAQSPSSAALLSNTTSSPAAAQEDETSSLNGIESIEHKETNVDRHSESMKRILLLNELDTFSHIGPSM